MDRLCGYHRGVVERASAWSHVDEDETARLAASIADQCRDGCVGRPRDGRPAR